MKSKTKHVKYQSLYGIHPVKEALIAQKRIVHQIFINENSRNARLDEIVSMASERNIKVTNVAPSDLSKIVKHEDHQHIVAHVSELPLIDYHDMVTSHAFIIICDQIMDPHNMGAIIRTALASGATGIITPKDHCTPLSATVSKISSGAMEHLNIARVTNLVRCIKALKTAGIWVFGLEGHAQISVYDISFIDRVALVIGGEHKGIRRLVRENCDQTVHIPQIGPLDSLNASVAAGIAMYEVFRQRQNFPEPL